MTWNPIRPTLLAFLSSIVLASGAGASSYNAVQTPYRPIGEANVFHLRPAAEQPGPEQPLLPRIVLKGITTLAKPRAILELAFPATQAAPARTEHYLLAEGQRSGPIELLEINGPDGAVKLSNSDPVMVVSFDTLEPGKLSQPALLPPTR